MYGRTSVPAEGPTMRGSWTTAGSPAPGPPGSGDEVASAGPPDDLSLVRSTSRPMPAAITTATMAAKNRTKTFIASAVSSVGAAVTSSGGGAVSGEAVKD